jgi:hypothetical protein
MSFEMGISVEQTCNSILGKIDQRIYRSLVYSGLESQSCIGNVNLKELDSFHPWGRKYTLNRLKHLVHRKYLEPCGKVKSVASFYIPALVKDISTSVSLFNCAHKALFLKK